MSLAGTNFLGRALAARTRQVRVSGAQALEFAVLAHVITTFRECAPASRRGVLLSWVHHEPPPANLSLRSVPKRATPSETSVGAHRDTSGMQPLSAPESPAGVFSRCVRGPCTRIVARISRPVKDECTMIPHRSLR